ncbi:DegT/DnrJ/EryC1/StrS family aminotransferase [Candidatus Omnitrophota bacterium]
MKSYPRHIVNMVPGAGRIIFGFNKSKTDYVSRFEKEFAGYIGVPYAIAVSSGRTALYLALESLGLKQGDEVALSAYNFPIVPLVIKKMGFVPVFVDADLETYNMDMDSVEKSITPRTKAVIATHLFGQACDIRKLKKICIERGIRLIEDCAHCCGAEYGKQRLGSFGDIAYFSFSMPKNITCFGGGMIIIKDTDINEAIRKKINQFYPIPETKVFKGALITYIIHFLLSPRIFTFFSYPVLRFFDLLGFGPSDRVLDKELAAFLAKDLEKDVARLNNKQARVGLMQLDRIEKINNRLKRNADLIANHLKNTDKIQLPSQIASSRGIFSYYRILVDEPMMLKRLLLRNGVDSQKGNIIDCSKLDFFRIRNKDSFPNTRILSEKGLEIPSNYIMKDSDILNICSVIKRALGED